jgi:hypothetical protein
MRGEKIYEYDLSVKGVTDYGVTLQAVLTGKEKIPPQGLRFDVALEGHAGGRLAGRVWGFDYIRARADGRWDLDIRATIETEDGRRIALSADGVAMPRAAEPIADLFENITLNTAAKDYEWVNTRQIWGFGMVNFSTGKIHIDAYMQ